MEYLKPRLYHAAFEKLWGLDATGFVMAEETTSKSYDPLMPGLFSLPGEDKETVPETCEAPPRGWVEDYVLPFLAGAAGAVLVAVATWVLQGVRPAARRPAGFALSLSGAACCRFFRRTRAATSMASTTSPDTIELQEERRQPDASGVDLEKGESFPRVTEVTSSPPPPTKTASPTATTTTVSTQTIGRKPRWDPVWLKRTGRPPWFPPQRSPWVPPTSPTHSVVTRVPSRSSSSAASATHSVASKSTSPDEEPTFYSLFGEDSRSRELQAWRDHLTGEDRASLEQRRASSNGRSRPWASSSRVSYELLSLSFP